MSSSFGESVEAVGKGAISLLTCLFVVVVVLLVLLAGAAFVIYYLWSRAHA